MYLSFLFLFLIERQPKKIQSYTHFYLSIAILAYLRSFLQIMYVYSLLVFSFLVHLKKMVFRRVGLLTDYYLLPFTGLLGLEFQNFISGDSRQANVIFPFRYAIISKTIKNYDILSQKNVHFTVILSHLLILVMSYQRSICQPILCSTYLDITVAKYLIFSLFFFNLNSFHNFHSQV